MPIRFLVATFYFNKWGADGILGSLVISIVTSPCSSLSLHTSSSLFCFEIEPQNKAITRWVAARLPLFSVEVLASFFQSHSAAIFKKKTTAEWQCEEEEEGRVNWGPAFSIAAKDCWCQLWHCCVICAGENICHCGFLFFDKEENQCYWDAAITTAVPQMIRSEWSWEQNAIC